MDSPPRLEHFVMNAVTVTDVVGNKLCSYDQPMLVIRDQDRNTVLVEWFDGVKSG